MTRYFKRCAAVLIGMTGLVMAMGFVLAQDQPAPASAATPAPLGPAQLDQLTAPIALYSDPLLGMVLAAATYPLEVVEAARWLDADDHASLKGGELDAALAGEGWDTSVKALVAVPEVLRMMNENLDWTEQLGDAFLSQQSDVMDSIQRLRQRAAASGGLQSGPQESVSTDEGEVVIEPSSPDVVYVPCYTPVIYGPWPWPDYPAFYFPPPAGFCYPGPIISFGVGFGIIGPYWGWGRWNWPRHGFYVAPRRPHRGPIPIRPWLHDPAHRRGVPYRDPTTARRFLGPNASSSRSYRGYPTAPAPSATPRLTPRMTPGQRPPRAAPSRPVPPAFQSYGSGSRVRAESARGAFSRSAPAGGFGHPGGGARPGGGGHPGGGRPPS